MKKLIFYIFLSFSLKSGEKKSVLSVLKEEIKNITSNMPEKIFLIITSTTTWVFFEELEKREEERDFNKALNKILTLSFAAIFLEPVLVLIGKSLLKEIRYRQVNNKIVNIKKID
jgi:hypothetical protein